MLCNTSFTSGFNLGNSQNFPLLGICTLTSLQLRKKPQALKSRRWSAKPSLNYNSHSNTLSEFHMYCEGIPLLGNYYLSAQFFLVCISPQFPSFLIIVLSVKFFISSSEKTEIFFGFRVYSAWRGWIRYNCETLNILLLATMKQFMLLKTSKLYSHTFHGMLTINE